MLSYAFCVLFVAFCFVFRVFVFCVVFMFARVLGVRVLCFVSCFSCVLSRVLFTVFWNIIVYYVCFV